MSGQRTLCLQLVYLPTVARSPLFRWILSVPLDRDSCLDRVRSPVAKLCRHDSMPPAAVGAQWRRQISVPNVFPPLAWSEHT